jgi:hypothetical protein
MAALVDPSTVSIREFIEWDDVPYAMAVGGRTFFVRSSNGSSSPYSLEPADVPGSRAPLASVLSYGSRITEAEAVALL